MEKWKINNYYNKLTGSKHKYMKNRNIIKNYKIKKINYRPNFLVKFRI